MPLSLAQVRLYSNFTTFHKISNISDNGQAVFESVPAGEYQIEVTAPGYEKTEDTAELLSPETTTYVHIEMRTTSAPAAAPVAPGVPLLAPGARKEMDKALDALQKGDTEAARKHLEKLRELAPGHPDVSYLWGIYWLGAGDSQQARSHLEKAVALDPKHSAALMALGALLVEQRRYTAAIPVLERAVVVRPDSWQAMWMLAGACFHQGQLVPARKHAQQALELAGERAPGLYLLLAHVHDQLGDTAEALLQLENYLLGDRPAAGVAEAQRLREQIRAREGGAHSEPPAPSETSLTVPLAGPKPSLPARPWVPPDIEERVPAVDPQVSCSLEDVLTGAGRRARELVGNLERFTATERVEHAELDAAGTVRRVQEKSFDYVVFIQEIRRGVLSVDESRDRSTSYSSFPTKLVSNGLPALALVFHPYYREDFEMRCEGLGRWRDEPAWQVYFRQKDDQVSRVRAYRMGAKALPVPLRGRAWLAVNSYRVLRLETELAAPLPEIGLEREHLAVTYQPVSFPHRDLTLWLPVAAEVYMHLRGKRYRHLHTFSEHMLFSVDTFDSRGNPSERDP